MVQCKVVALGKYGSRQVEFASGKTLWVIAECTMVLELGKAYEIKTEKRHNDKTGKDNVYVTEAGHLSGEGLKRGGTPPGSPSGSSSGSPKADPDRMSKAEWAAKDAGIKWLACLRTCAILHAHRSESSVDNVILDARVMYSSPTGVTAGATAGEEESQF